jgi:1-acyl-sn-glycerol-3-phosphate acyltransferase
MIVFIRSTLFNVFLPIWTVFISTILSPLIIFRNTKVMSILGISWSYVMIGALRVICNIKTEIVGVENLPTSPCIIACKHQSVVETAFFLQYLKFPVYVIKKELLKIPFYGSFLGRMGMIPIDRVGGMASLKQLLRDCEKALNEKRSIIIFPEGTRVRPGISVEYHAGIAALHSKFPNIPIVPVAVNSGLFWPKNSWLKYPGTIILKVLEPITHKMDKDELLKYLKTEIDVNSDELCNGV